MARGDNLNRRLLQRIEDSSFTMRVHYPPVRPIITGGSPATSLQSPLGGPAPTTVYPVAGTPSKPPVDLKCLWYDAVSSVMSSLAKDRRVVSAVGWVAGAQALAQVRVSDAALDEDDYLGKTVFTAAEAVEFGGHRYRVLSVQPVGAGHRMPTTYYVWLAGSEV
jgi:hypothetical protein